MVELKHIDSDLERIFARVAVNDFEQLVDTTRGKAGVGGGPIDREGLARTSLQSKKRRVGQGSLMRVRS